jgi:putative peptide maturation dehydrogenase
VTHSHAANDARALGRVKRSSHVFFFFDEGSVFDFTALLEGSYITKRVKQISVVSLLRAKVYPISWQQLRILFDIPSDEWIGASHLVRRAKIDLPLLRELLRKGLVVGDCDDPVIQKLRARDSLISSSQWNKYALLDHIMTKWRDRDLRQNIPKDGRTLVDVLAARPERYADMVSDYGTPPPHFHTLSNPPRTVELPLRRRNDGLYKVLTDRKTTRSFDANTPLALEDLAQVLYYVWGCHGYCRIREDVTTLKKTSPSGGALHPIEVYPVVRNVTGLEPGAYHYNVENHRLDLVIDFAEQEARDWIAEISAGQSYFADAHVAFVMSARFARFYWKYRNHERAYAVIYMEAAHLSQSLYLVCTDLGLGAYVTAAINAENIEERLGFDGIIEGAIAVGGCGKRCAGQGPLEPEYMPFVPRHTAL